MTAYLALDCATSIGSVAVGEPGRPAAEIVITGRRHAAELVPASQECLRIAGLGMGDLAGVLVADGPGSFTGLRIAFATAAGLLRDRVEQPLFTAPSLLGAAWVGSQMTGPGVIAALFDALRGQVFAAVYEIRDDVRVLLPPSATTMTDLLASGLSPALAVGDGAALYSHDVREWTGREPVIPPAGAPRASALIDLMGLGVLRRVHDLATWEPSYGRPAEAQVRWERTHGRALPGATGD
jgi:tRNA threonylcarbamoyladenosine biosynthesis protein TsaB